MEQNIAKILERAADTDRGILFFDRDGKESRLSYAKLLEQALFVLGGLQTAGLKKGSHVVFQFVDNRNFLRGFWGCILGGFLPVPLPVGTDEEKSRKLMNVLTLLDDPYVLTDESMLPLLTAILKDTGFPVPLSCEQMFDIGKSGVPHDAQPSDLAMIQFSSGSTGQPKGVQLTQRNIVSNVHSIIGAVDFNAQDSILSWLPLTHDMGLIGAHITSVLLKIDQYIMQTELFMRRPQLWFEKISKYDITLTLAPNFAYKLILSLLKSGMQPDWALSKLRYILNGAEPISAKVCDLFLQAMSAYGLRPGTILNVYGMAEASLAVAFSEPHERMEYTYFDRDNLSIGNRIQQTKSTEHSVAIVNVGKAVPDCEIRIADEKDNVLADETVGEIQLSGAGITIGYYKGGALNDSLFTTDGWLHTGDIGFIHAGKLYISGRYKEILFINGQNYYPYDIEETIEQQMALPTGSTAVCGVPDKQAGRDRVYVFTESIGGKELSVFTAELRQMLMEQMKLYADAVVPVEKLPLTISGKIQRVALRQQVEAQQASEKATSSNEHLAEPFTQTETLLTELCQNCLLEEGNLVIGRDNSFMEIGLDSVKLVQLAEQISNRFNKKVGVTDLFAHPTIREMAFFLDGAASSRMPEVIFPQYDRRFGAGAADGCVCFTVEDCLLGDVWELTNVFSDAIKGLCGNEHYSFHCMCGTHGLIDYYEYNNSVLTRGGQIRCEDLVTAKIGNPYAFTCILYDSESNRNNHNMLNDYDIAVEYHIWENRIRFDLYHSAYSETRLICALADNIQERMMEIVKKECTYA